MTLQEKPGVEYLSTVDALNEDGMNHTFEAEKNLSLNEAAKKFPLIILWSIAAGSAGLLFGYDSQSSDLHWCRANTDLALCEFGSCCERRKHFYACI